MAVPSEVFVLLASTAGEAVLVFVTVFDLAGGVAAIDFAVLVFVDVFWVLWEKPVTAKAPTIKRLKNSFFINVFLLAQSEPVFGESFGR